MLTMCMLPAYPSHYAETTRNKKNNYISLYNFLFYDSFLKDMFKLTILKN